MYYSGMNYANSLHQSCLIKEDRIYGKVTEAYTETMVGMQPGFQLARGHYLS